MTFTEASMADFTWCDPPRSKRGAQPTDWEPVLAKLRDHPGRWARIRICGTKSGASNLATKLRKRYPGFNFTARRTDDASSAVWALYVQP